MSSLMETRLECNNSIKINFDGGDLSSDTGLFLIKEFADKIGFDKVIENIFKTNDPVFKTVLNKKTLASQPTLSRFFNRMDQDTLDQCEEIHRAMRQRIYSIEAPENVLFDTDSTLFGTYGNQEDEGYNYHYSSHGYHPLLCYDELTGDLLKAELRDGTVYTSNGAVEFIKPVLTEYMEQYPSAKVYLRGDSDNSSHSRSYSIQKLR